MFSLIAGVPCFKLSCILIVHLWQKKYKEKKKNKKRGWTVPALLQNLSDFSQVDDHTNVTHFHWVCSAAAIFSREPGVTNCAPIRNRIPL